MLENEKKATRCIIVPVHVI